MSEQAKTPANSLAGTILANLNEDAREVFGSWL
jgi:hypothetical protein